VILGTRNHWGLGLVVGQAPHCVRLGRKLRIDRAQPRDARAAALRLGNPVGGGKLELYRPSTAQASSAALMDLVSTITCPRCGRQSAETMPTNACQFFYECTHCGALLKPKAGDCCVFCSYGDVPCPSIQQTKELGQAIGCCSRELQLSAGRHNKL
jgi:hypothetical protein